MYRGKNISVGLDRVRESCWFDCVYVRYDYVVEGGELEDRLFVFSRRGASSRLGVYGWNRFDNKDSLIYDRSRIKERVV